jgi:transposase
LRLADFYDTAVDAQLPEASRLAETIQTWWPAILVALTEDASNARTEGFNRIIKQTGYRLTGSSEIRVGEASGSQDHP